MLWGWRKERGTRLKFDLEKLKDSNVLETFQAFIGEKFAPLTIMNNEDTDMDSMITIFNTAVTETASEILGKHRQKKKKTWLNAEILDLCDKRRELRKKRFEPEGSEKYKEVNNNIKRCMKKAKENWIGEQSSGIEENLRKNNSKRAHQFVKDLTSVEQRKATISSIVQENASRKNDRYWADWENLSCTVTRPVEVHQYWTPPRQKQRTTTTSFAKKWRLQYIHWRKRSQLELTTFQQNLPMQVESHNNLQHDLADRRLANNLQHDLADRRMANPLDPVLGNHHITQERQPAAVSDLPNDQSH